MSACSGSTFAPSSLTTWPFTVTRPAVISSSQARREAMPAAASTFCKRSSDMSQLYLGTRPGRQRRTCQGIAIKCQQQAADGSIIGERGLWVKHADRPDHGPLPVGQKNVGRTGSAQPVKPAVGAELGRQGIVG